MPPPPCAGRPRSTRTPRAPAFFNVYPELCHNELAGWGQNGDATRQLITLVNLRHDAEHPQVSRRFDLVADVLREVVADILEVRAAGEGDLAQLLDLALIGDFVSLHLAGQEGIDPGPIPVLDELKAAAHPGRPRPNRRLGERGRRRPAVGPRSGQPDMDLVTRSLSSECRCRSVPADRRVAVE